MTISETSRDETAPEAPARVSPAEAHLERRAAVPERPSLAGKDAAPVLVKAPPPVVVRIAQLLWVTSLLAGAAGVVYLMVIRQAQLPEIADLVRGVDGSRADETYTSAADIVFWSVFTPLVAMIMLQIVLLVSFANRRPKVRWWQFGSVLFLAGVVLIAGELVAFGDRGLPLERILQAQVVLAALGLLVSVLPPALRWSARRHDIRRGPEAPVGDAQL
ncbi:hypothetical protein GCM10009775_21230 [Microbacterium aoyamense]|uniref:Uncharacterized protein n=1 Tax=Microbacterium aoyamense TaxID=344166 RepID=A0ABN2PS46_9MICO|nr:hypothetical protein [Microbacterium aoyamense]